MILFLFYFRNLCAVWSQNIYFYSLFRYPPKPISSKISLVMFSVHFGRRRYTLFSFYICLNINPNYDNKLYKIITLNLGMWFSRWQSHLAPFFFRACVVLCVRKNNESEGKVESKPYRHSKSVNLMTQNWWHSLLRNQP